MTDETIYDRFSLENFPECFKEYADLLDWYKYWEKTLDTSNPPFWNWFVGGELNACYNCVDRHLAKYKNKTAIHFVPEPEDERIEHVTFQELFVRVNEFSALLREFAGLKRGDCVTLQMPMTAELPITMLACARLGVIHSEVFAGFSGKSCADRIVDSGSKVLITMDGYYRTGKLLDHKENADIAVEEAKKQGHTVDKVLIWQRYPGKYSSATPLVNGRDHVVNELLKDFRGKTCGARAYARGRTALSHVHQWHDGQTKRCAAQYRWLSCLCGRDVKVYSGHSSRGCVLVYGRYRLDHGPFLHRLRSFGCLAHLLLYMRACPIIRMPGVLGGSRKSSM